MQPAPDPTPLPNGQVLEAGERLPIAVGEIVGGKYFVERILGIGGMGVVAAANHEELQQRVALKVMRAARSTPEGVDRFLREARAAVRLKSSHVAKILDVGTLDAGLPFMVMEHLEGSDLASILERDGALPVETAVEYLLQACDAISEAHALGIIHRDLKPENLFVTERRDGAPLVKVLDFGISKVMGLADAAAPAGRAITHDSVVMGSPAYMSPEQARSPKAVDERTDIWSLGAILYELVTGQQAFHAPSVADIFVKVLEKPPPPPRLVRPEVSEGLEEVILRCLERDRDRRFASVDELARALEPHGPSTRSMSAAPMWEPSIVVDVDHEALRSGVTSETRRTVGARRGPPTLLQPDKARARQRRRRIVLAGVSVGVLAAGVAAALLVLPEAPWSARSEAPAAPGASDDLAPRVAGEAMPTSAGDPPPGDPALANDDPSSQEATEAAPGTDLPSPKLVATAPAASPAARTRPVRPRRGLPPPAATAAAAAPAPASPHPSAGSAKYRRTEW